MFDFLSPKVPPWGLYFFGNDILFRHPGRFIWASLIAFFGILVVWDWRRRKKVLQDPSIKMHLSTSRVPRLRQSICWWIWFSIATALLIAAYANPEKVRTEWERVFAKIRITFLFDVSISMKRAEDVEPNRFEAAKVVIRDLITLLDKDPQLKGRYPLALIPFSGAALPYFLPFTTSKGEFLYHLDALDVEVITKKGTSLWAALRAYDELLLDSPSKEKDTLDLGILISDGGKEEGAEERPLLPRLMKDLRDPHRTTYFLASGERIIVSPKEPQRKVVLYTVGMGKVEIDGEGRRVARPVPLKIRDKAGNFIGFEHIKEGDVSSPVLTSTLDEKILMDLAEQGGGAYYHFTDRETILRKFKELIMAHRMEVDRIPHKRYESLRAWFLFPAFAILYFLFGYGGWIFRIVRRVLSAKFAKGKYS